MGTLYASIRAGAMTRSPHPCGPSSTTSPIMTRAQTPASSPRQPPLVRAAAWAADLLRATHRADAWSALGAALRQLADYQNFIVMDYVIDREPIIVDASLDRAYLTGIMADYLRGLYQLDPFYRAFADGAEGFRRMDAIAPQDFRESEYFVRHYRSTGVVDELRFLVPVGPGRSVHVLIERESALARFSLAEARRYANAQPIVSAFVQEHVAWAERLPWQDAPRPPLDLRAQIRAMAPGEITPREGEILELMLRGHSAKSIGSTLHIEEGTVTNHKRNVYAKLRIHSQAQLFDLLLRTLSKE